MFFLKRQKQYRQRSTLVLILFVVLTFLLTATISSCIYFLLKACLNILPLKYQVPISSSFQINTTLLLVFLFFSYAWFLYLSFKKRRGVDVAASIGAVPVSEFKNDKNVARLVRCVAEMSIASGVKAPPVLVLPEQSINAMVAGFDASSAAIIVTRGAIDQLDQQELQGVIGHEFSHLYHEDTSFVLKLFVCVKTLNDLFSLGGWLFSSAFATSDEENKVREGPIFYGSYGLILAFLMIIIGAFLIFFGCFGYLSANFLRSVFMRQREFLADAASVQYARNKDGLVRTLCRISQMKLKKRDPIYLRGSRYDTMAHLFIVPVSRRMDEAWFATHPPLKERITKLIEL